MNAQDFSDYVFSVGLLTAQPWQGVYEGFSPYGIAVSPATKTVHAVECEERPDGPISSAPPSSGDEGHA